MSSRYQVHVLDAEPVSVGRGELCSSGSVGKHYQASLGTLLAVAETPAGRTARRLRTCRQLPLRHRDSRHRRSTRGLR